MLVIADIFEIAARTLLVLLSTISPPLFIIAALRGLSKGTYWPSYHAIFSKNRDRKKAGEQIGLINAVLITGASLGPVIGGIIASYYSISATYIIGIFLLSVGALPLLYGKDITKGHVLDLRKLNSKGLWRDLIALYSDSVNKAIVSIAWPLIIVLYVSSYAGIGALASIVTITSVIVTLYVGRKERIVGEKHYLAEGANIAAVSHAARLFATSPPAIVALNAINGITDALIKTPFTTRYYANADRQPRIEYIVIMEMAHSLAWMSYGLLLALVAMFFSLQVTLFVGVIVGVPAALGIRLIR